MNLKVIRVTVHIFQKSTGSPENFDPFDSNGNQTSDYYWLRDMVYLASSWMAQLLPLMNNNGSPNILDTRIRYDCVQVCEWKNDNLWDNNFHGDRSQIVDMYNYVMSQPNVIYKNNSIHILIPGKPYIGPGKPNVLESQGGRASDIGDKQWTMMNNVYSFFLSDPGSKSTGLLLHELGHNLGRFHTFPSDDCDDTPDDYESCWCDQSCGNNIMGYNCRKSALSRCQVIDMHNCILKLNGWQQSNIIDCLRDPLIVTAPVISGSNCISGNTASNYSLSNYDYGTNVTWTVSPANFFSLSNGCGNNFTLTPVSSANGTATLSVSVDWGGIIGIRNATKVINLTSLNQIDGTFTYPGTSQNIPLSSSQPNVVNGSVVNVTLNYPTNTTFTWTRTSGAGVMSTWNFGRNGTMNMAAGSSTNYYVSFVNSCGTTVSRPFTFYRPSTSLFSLSPNPATSQVTLSGKSAFSIDYVDETLLSKKLTLDPTIDKITIFDNRGLKVFESKQKNKPKVISINVQHYNNGTYRVEIQDGVLNYFENLIIIR